MVNFRIVPIVPKMWGQLTIATLCHMTLHTRLRAKIDSFESWWNLALGIFASRGKPPETWTCFYLMPPPFPCPGFPYRMHLLPKFSQNHPRVPWLGHLCLPAGAGHRISLQAVQRAHRLSIRPISFQDIKIGCSLVKLTFFLPPYMSAAQRQKSSSHQEM